VLDDQCEPTWPGRSVDDVGDPVSGEDVFRRARPTARDRERRDEQLGVISIEWDNMESPYGTREKYIFKSKA